MDARAAHAKLVDRLRAAEAAMAEKRAVGERLALNGASDTQLDTAEAETRAAEDRVKTLSAALVQLAGQVTEGEQALADAIDQRDRNVVADGLLGMAKAIADAYPEFDDAGAALLRAITGAQAQIAETAGLVNFLQSTRHEVAAACNLLGSGIAVPRHRHPRRNDEIQNSSAARPRAAKPPKPNVPVERVFSLAHLKWTAGDEVRTCSPYTQIDLPTDLVPSALSHQYVDRFDSPRTKALIAAHGQSYWSPRLDDARLIDLNALVAAATNSDQQHIGL
jgi:hypothetical protein